MKFYICPMCTVFMDLTSFVMGINAFIFVYALTMLSIASSLFNKFIKNCNLLGILLFEYVFSRLGFTCWDMYSLAWHSLVGYVFSC